MELSEVDYSLLSVGSFFDSDVNEGDDDFFSRVRMTVLWKNIFNIMAILLVREFRGNETEIDVFYSQVVLK